MHSINWIIINATPVVPIFFTVNAINMVFINETCMRGIIMLRLLIIVFVVFITSCQDQTWTPGPDNTLPAEGIWQGTWFDLSTPDQIFTGVLSPTENENEYYAFLRSESTGNFLKGPVTLSGDQITGTIDNWDTTTNLGNIDFIGTLVPKTSITTSKGNGQLGYQTVFEDSTTFYPYEDRSQNLYNVFTSFSFGHIGSYDDVRISMMENGETINADFHTSGFLHYYISCRLIGTFKRIHPNHNMYKVDFTFFAGDNGAVAPGCEVGVSRVGYAFRRSDGDVDMLVDNPASGRPYYYYLESY